MTSGRPPASNRRTPVHPAFPRRGDDVLHGYTARLHADPGEELAYMLSGTQTAAVSAVEILHADPDPSGPGYQERTLDWIDPTPAGLAHRELRAGSWGEIEPCEALDATGSFALALWCRPTANLNRWATIAARWREDDWGFGLFLTGHHTLAAVVSRTGKDAQWAVAVEQMRPDQWHQVAMAYDCHEGRLTLMRAQPGRVPTIVESVGAAVPVHRPDAPLRIAASEGDAGRWAHFNGRLGQLCIYDHVLDADAAAALANHARPEDVGRLRARWHLGRRPSDACVPEVADRAGPLRLHNMPARGVTGPRFGGTPATIYTSEPDWYDAVHFHDDDLEDAEWPETGRVRIPADATPGIYAVRVEGRQSLLLPFVVRGRAAKALRMLVPTLTWRAYASSRLPWGFSDDGVQDATGTIYDLHNDGSPVYYATLRRPSRGINPGAGVAHGTHTAAADMHFIHWARSAGFDLGLLADEQLHAEGSAALTGCRCLVLGAHPEYVTERMLDALQRFLKDGGRLFYLGGNGLYWVTTIDPTRPHIMEVRKSGEGDYQKSWLPDADGEYLHSTVPEPGGLWRRRDRPPSALVGVEYAANSFWPAAVPVGYERTPESRQSSFDWVFDGVEEEVIGAYGLRLGTAAGYEMDAVTAPPRGAQTTVLATARSAVFRPPWHIPVAPRAEMALTSFDDGGAAFACGSIAWASALVHDHRPNDIARITSNVLRRFLMADGPNAV